MDNNAANQRLLGTVEMRDALVAVQTHVAMTGAACDLWCVALASLAAPGASRLLFRVPAVRDAHATLRDFAASYPDASKWWHVAAAVLR